MDILSNEQLAGHLNAVLAIDESAPEGLRLIHTELVRALVRSAAKRLGEAAELGTSAADWQDGHAKGFASGFDHCVGRVREVLGEQASEAPRPMTAHALRELQGMLPQLMASHRKDLLGNPPAAKPEPDRRGATPFEAIPPQVLADRCALYFDRTKLFRDGQLHGLERAAQVVETHAHLAGELKANHTLSKAAHAIRGEIYALNQQGA